MNDLVLDDKLNALRKKTGIVSQKSTMNQGVGYKYQRVILLDVSDSMIGDKITGAKKVLQQHITSYDGLVVFGSEVHHVDPKKISHIVCNGFTNMMDALKLGVSFFPTEMIVITDGDPNCKGGPEDIINWATHVVGVKINTIGIGYDCNSAFLETLSEITGGAYNHCDAIHQLDGVMLQLEAPRVAIAL